MKKTIIYISFTIICMALLSSCDEQSSSDDVNLSIALQDKGITWLSSETYGSGEWTQTTLKYDDLIFDGTKTTHNKYSRSTTGDFQPEPQSTKNFVLTSSGWLQSNNQLIVSKINGGASIALTDPAEPLITYTLLAFGLPEDLTNKKIHEHLKSSNKDTGWANEIIENTLFNMGSNAYQVSLQTNTDRYTMWDLNCEEEFGCNEVWSLQQPAESLADISTGIAINASNPDEFKGAFLTWNQDNKPMLSVELVTDGSANFYIMESNSGIANPSTATKSSNNTWQEKEAFGKTLYLIEVPEPLATDFGFNEDSRHIVLFEHDGKVRRGKYELAGHTESFRVYNNSAKSDILANLKQSDNSGGGNNGNWQN
ncbi:MAG TPA: hypothetical protein ENJ32_14470 [Crenotrichaceae bacterium]|nr:hypothetical protein [Crenotrichaceae bacterium]